MWSENKRGVKDVAGALRHGIADLAMSGTGP